jgi:hypothetical protein
LVVENAHNYPTPREEGIKTWETRSAEDMAEPAGLAGLPFERMGVYELESERLPITILIPSYGLLQVAGVDARTDQVIVEYKRVVREAEKLIPLKKADKPRDRRSSETQRIKEGAGVSMDAARKVVGEWLLHVGAQQWDLMWPLTTRESSAAGSIDLAQTWALKSIQPKYALGNGTAAMVVSTRFKDNAGRLRALLFSLVKSQDRWLVREYFNDSPENIQRRVEGFVAHPGVSYDVRSDDMLGDWTDAFASIEHRFKPDGFGEVRKRLPDAKDRKERDFRWELEGDLLRQIYPGQQNIEAKIVRLDDDVVVMRYSDGAQATFQRVPSDP